MWSFSSAIANRALHTAHPVIPCQVPVPYHPVPNNHANPSIYPNTYPSSANGSGKKCTCSSARNYSSSAEAYSSPLSSAMTALVAPSVSTFLNVGRLLGMSSFSSALEDMIGCANVTLPVRLLLMMPGNNFGSLDSKTETLTGGCCSARSGGMLVGAGRTPACPAGWATDPPATELSVEGAPVLLLLLLF